MATQLSEPVKTLMKVRDRFMELSILVGDDRNFKREHDIEDEKERAFVGGVFDALIMRQLLEEKQNGTDQATEDRYAFDVVHDAASRGTDPS